ncbi:MAG: ABC transporter substrate-binding protein [Betaproteobacteria bacterium]|nr:MAG: ABC transporter substrate-binding protein [Betaproteobacteria bacterium]
MQRRRFIQAAGAAAGASALGFPSILRAQAESIRLGLLTIKTGALASGGIDMERGLNIFLKEKNYTIGGRKIVVSVADSGGVPAQARTKMQELVERERVQAVVGPLAAFEALAMDDYIRAAQIPTLPVAGAEDMTQRKANPWFVRATSTSAGCAHPMADYCAKHLRYKRMAAIADDFAYGHEMLGGFQKVFEDAGGTLVQKLFSPLNAPDYGSYIAQLKPDVDAVFLGFAGSNGFRFFKQVNEYGLKTPMVGGMTAFDEVAVRNMGDYALGSLSSCWYTAQLDNPINRRFVAAYRADNGYDPGQYASGTYLYGEVLFAAIEALKGRIEDKQTFIKALRAVRVDTLRGPIAFDEYGNVVGNIYIRKVERKDGRLVNTPVYTYPNVSQFWTYDPKEFLKQPVYSRDWPPMKAGA